jgi:hypothetical protein
MNDLHKTCRVVIAHSNPASNAQISVIDYRRHFSVKASAETADCR